MTKLTEPSLYHIFCKRAIFNYRKLSFRLDKIFFWAQKFSSENLKIKLVQCIKTIFLFCPCWKRYFPNFVPLKKTNFPFNRDILENIILLNRTKQKKLYFCLGQKYHFLGSSLNSILLSFFFLIKQKIPVFMKMYFLSIINLNSLPTIMSLQSFKCFYIEYRITIYKSYLDYKDGSKS